MRAQESGVKRIRTAAKRRRRGGGAGGGGIAIVISSSTIADNASIGGVIGTLSVLGGTGVYTFSLTSNPGGLFSIVGAQLQVAAGLTAGSDPITVHVDNGAGSTGDQNFSITVTHAVVGGVPTFELLGF